MWILRVNEGSVTKRTWGPQVVDSRATRQHARGISNLLVPILLSTSDSKIEAVAQERKNMLMIFKHSKDPENLEAPSTEDKS